MESNDAVDTNKEQEKPVSYTVVGVRFRSCGKIYTFEVDDIDAARGSKVVVDSEMGISIGHVAIPKYIIRKTAVPLKKVLRIATDKDFEAVKNNRVLEDEARAFCIEKVKALNLPMKIVATETTLDKKRLIFYFTADGRIDFRELVRDLAAKFKTRIEMRQIGVRDEVKMLGGFGACGRQTCCSLFLTSFEPITIRMAKEQDLSINQSRLSGICGRLMCCLGYEYKDSAAAEAAPASGDESLVTVAEETSDSNLQSVYSDSICAGTIQEQPTFTCQCSAMTEELKQSAPPQHGKQPEKPLEKGAGEIMRHKHGRRRRKRHGHEKSPLETIQVNKPQSSPAAPQDQSGIKDKGRPFNRRRKFWKKKKHEQK